MKADTKKYIQELRGKYEPFSQIMQKEIEMLNDFERDDELASMMTGYREHPISEMMVKSAIIRFQECARKLLTDRDLSTSDRIACFVGMDWAKWYIDIATVNSDEVFAQIDEQVMEIARNAGLAK